MSYPKNDVYPAITIDSPSSEQKSAMFLGFVPTNAPSKEAKKIARHLGLPKPIYVSPFTFLHESTPDYALQKIKDLHDLKDFIPSPVSFHAAYMSAKAHNFEPSMHVASRDNKTYISQELAQARKSAVASKHTLHSLCKLIKTIESNLIYLPLFSDPLSLAAHYHRTINQSHALKAYRTLYPDSTNTIQPITPPSKQAYRILTSNNTPHQFAHTAHAPNWQLVTVDIGFPHKHTVIPAEADHIKLFIHNHNLSNPTALIPLSCTDQQPLPFAPPPASTATIHNANTKKLNAARNWCKSNGTNKYLMPVLSTDNILYAPSDYINKTDNAVNKLIQQGWIACDKNYNNLYQQAYRLLVAPTLNLKLIDGVCYISPQLQHYQASRSNLDKNNKTFISAQPIV